MDSDSMSTPLGAMRFEAHMQQAAQMYLEKRVAPARALCLEVLRENPRFAGALGLLGMVEELDENTEGAIHLLERAIALEGGNSAHYLHLGIVLQRHGMLDDAARMYRHTLTLQPGHFGAINNLGAIERDRGRIAEARALYLQALRQQPMSAEILTNLGNLCVDECRYEEALQWLERAVEANPGYKDGCSNLGTAQLRMGNFAEGWRNYEHRLQQRKYLRREFAVPRWQGEALGAGGLLLWGDQGIGDEIQFAGLLPELQARVPHLLLEVDPRLQPLLRRSWPDLEFQQGEAAGQEYVAELPLGSLPGILRPDLASFAHTPSPYLRADGAMAASLRSQYGNGTPLIGVAWHTTNKTSGAKRSLEPRALAPLMSLAGVRWVSLQYGKNEALQSIVRKSELPILVDASVNQMKDMDRFAAQIAALDLVITIDNTTAHLAGALGKATWLLLPFSADWRWFQRREDSPWYPSLRLFRQQKMGQWEGVIGRVRAELAVWLGKRTGH